LAIRQAHERKARERAREVREEYGLNNYPLAVETLAAAVELPIEELSGFPENTYGALYKEANNFRIVVSTRCHSDGQRRFTLCHELGHYFLDGHLDALFESGAEVHMSDTSEFRGRKYWYEIEADAFAAELLVPTPLAQAVIAKADSGLAGIRSLETGFGASLSCAAVRFANLTAEPVAVILSHGRDIEWVSWSRSMQSHSWTRKPIKGEWAPPGSVTHALASSPERVMAGESAYGQGLLVDWFERAPAVSVLEEAVGLGTYGRVLTVLTCPGLPSPDSQYESREREMERERNRDWRDAMRPWGWDQYDDLNDE
jgi:Zn-dependent peptidase ImmA (M78 family)